MMNVTPKKVINGKLVDSYCWGCHKEADEINCSYCCRSFHKSCLKKLKLHNIEFGCECKFTTVNGRKRPLWNERELKDLLQLALLESLTDKKNLQKKTADCENRFYTLFKEWQKEVNNLCKVVDVDILMDSIKMPPFYKTTAQFYADVKWLYHNCYICYGPEHSHSQQAHIFVKNVKSQLLEIEACQECYKQRFTGDPQFFTHVCSDTHPIVWAKMRGFPFWPAKCVYYNNSHADVRFFGTHDRSNILLDQVFRISKYPPFKPSRRESAKYKEAMAELAIYQINYEQSHGSFRFFPIKTPLDKNVVMNKKVHKQVKGRSKSKNSASNASCDTPANESEQIGDSPYSPGGTAARKMTPKILNVSTLHESSPSERNVTNSHLVVDEDQIVNMTIEVAPEVDEQSIFEEERTSQEDEITMIQETQDHTIVDTMQQNPLMVKTLSELLLSNRPVIRDYLASFGNSLHKLFLLMFLEANRTNLDMKDFKGIQMTQVKMYGMITDLRKENADLKEKLQKSGSKEQFSVVLASLKGQHKKYMDEKEQYIDSLTKKIRELEEEKETWKSYSEERILPMFDFGCQVDISGTRLAGINEQIESNSPSCEGSNIQQLMENEIISSSGTDIPQHVIDLGHETPSASGTHTPQQILDPESTLSPGTHMSHQIIEQETTNMVLFENQPPFTGVGGPVMMVPQMIQSFFNSNFQYQPQMAAIGQPLAVQPSTSYESLMTPQSSAFGVSPPAIGTFRSNFIAEKMAEKNSKKRKPETTLKYSRKKSKK